MPVLRPELALLLSLTACEHADAVRAEEPPPPAPAPEPTAPPAVAPAVAPVAPAPAEPTPAPAIRTTLPRPSDAELDRRCMSRAGCHWKGENTAPRVVKKAAK